MQKNSNVKEEKLYSGEITDDNETILVGIFNSKELAKLAIDRYMNAENERHGTNNWFYGYYSRISEVIINDEIALNRLHRKKIK